MRQDERAPFAAALEQARRAAYPPGEYVGQESFMPAAEIVALAGRAGVGPGTDVLDLCCGVAGPGLLVVERFGCRYLGVDYSEEAVQLARGRARERGADGARFVVGRVPPLPALPPDAPERFDVVLLLETMLAFDDKAALLAAISAVLGPGGRLALTLEEGLPLSAAERAAMPDADTVHLVPLGELVGLLQGAGLTITSVEERTASHLAVARSLLAAYTAAAERAAVLLGDRAVTELLDAHRLWVDWMADGRVRKYAVVATRPPGPP